MKATHEDKLRFDSLTPKQRQGLRDILKDEKNPRQAIFPGAIGRVGASLVRRKLVTSLGRQVFAGNRPHQGEQPDAWVAYAFTPLGRDWAESIYRVDLSSFRKHSSPRT